MKATKLPTPRVRRMEGEPRARELMTASDVCDTLGLSRASGVLYKAMRRGDVTLTRHKVGSFSFFDRDEVTDVKRQMEGSNGG